MPFRLCSWPLLSAFWKEHLTKNLRFKDAGFEAKYLESKNFFHLLNFKLVCIVLLVLIIGNLIVNPFSFDLAQIKFILPFLTASCFLIMCYFLITRKLLNYSQFALTFIILLFVIGSGEMSISMLGASDWTPSMFWVLAIHYQTASLLLIIARIGCFLNLFALWIVQTYMWTLHYRKCGFSQSNHTALVTYIVYLLVLPALSFCSEFEDRKMFFEVRMRESNLKAFQNLIKDVLPSSIILFNKEKILFSNEKCKEMFGVDDEEQLIAKLINIKVFQKNSKQIKRRQMGESPERKKKSLYDLIEERRINMNSSKISNSFDYFEAKLKAASKSCREYTYSVQIGYTLWDSKASTMIIINDISTINDYYKELGEHKDHLLATVSHELRTPLNGIMGMLEVSIENSKEEAIRNNMEIMQKSAKLLLSMINDILDFSLISKNKLRLNLSAFNVVNLVSETIKILELQATLKGITLNWNSQVRNPFVKTDPNRLRQVILNLVGNAIKFTERGNVTITLKEIESQSDIINQDFLINDESIPEAQEVNLKEDISMLDDICEGEVRRAFTFECEDTGIGIAKENQKGIFKIFGRLNQANKNINQNGVGLGLAISQQLVKALNKRFGSKSGISLRSQAGIGSVFSFTLNLLGCSSAEISSGPYFDFCRNEPVVSRPVSLFNMRKQNFKIPVVIPQCLETGSSVVRILAVDDDQINLLVIKNYLSGVNLAERQFTLVTANNGSEALETVKKYSSKGTPFHLILMDCNMPIMDGYEASRILNDMMFKGLITGIPIIAITANTTNADKTKCLQNGMNHYLAKPLKKLELIEKIDKALKEKAKPI